jgi:hypothetical protein
VVDALLAGHFEVVAAPEADVVVLLEVLDVQDHATLVTPRPQPLATVHRLAALVALHGTPQAHADGAIEDGEAVKGAIAVGTRLAGHHAAAAAAGARGRAHRGHHKGWHLLRRLGRQGVRQVEVCREHLLPLLLVLHR